MKKAEKRKQLIKEHKRLVQVLRSPSHADDKREAKIQEKELKEYEDAEKSSKKVKKSILTPKEFAIMHRLLKK